MEKKGLMLVVLAVVLVVSAVAEAGDRYSNSYSPTLDAWRMAGERNGYEAGYADAYSGYRAADLRRFAPEYCEGYSLGYRDGTYHRGCGGCGDYGYRQGSYPAPQYPQPAPQIYWGVTIRGKHGSVRIGGRN